MYKMAANAWDSATIWTCIARHGNRDKLNLMKIVVKNSNHGAISGLERPLLAEIGIPPLPTIKNACNFLTVEDKR